MTCDMWLDHLVQRWRVSPYPQTEYRALEILYPLLSEGQRIHFIDEGVFTEPLRGKNWATAGDRYNMAHSHLRFRYRGRDGLVLRTQRKGTTAWIDHPVCIVFKYSMHQQELPLADLVIARLMFYRANPEFFWQMAFGEDVEF